MSEQQENHILNLELEIDGLSEDLQNTKSELVAFRNALYEVMKYHMPDDNCKCCPCVHARELLKIFKEQK